MADEIPFCCLTTCYGCQFYSIEGLPLCDRWYDGRDASLILYPQGCNEWTPDGLLC